MPSLLLAVALLSAHPALARSTDKAEKRVSGVRQDAIAAIEQMIPGLPADKQDEMRVREAEIMDEEARWLEGRGDTAGGLAWRRKAATVRAALQEDELPEAGAAAAGAGVSRVAADATRRAAGTSMTVCYQSGLATQPTLAGELVVTVQVAPDGTVADATIKRSDLHAPDVEACAVKVAKGLVFPTAAGPSVVSFPYHFEPQAPKGD